MAIHAIIPLSLVLPAINGEVHAIVVEFRRYPGRLTVTALAIGWKSGGGMAGVVRLVIIAGMAPVTGIGGVGVIAVVAGIAIICDGNVGAPDRIDGIVVESGGNPGCFGMAGCAIRRELYCGMVGVGCLIVIISVATEAGVRGVVVIAVVAGYAIVCDGRMPPVKRVKLIVDTKRRRIPSRFGGMARSAIPRQPQSLMAGVKTVVVIKGMAGFALGRGTLIAIGMT